MRLTSTSKTRASNVLIIQETFMENSIKNLFQSPLKGFRDIHFHTNMDEETFSNILSFMIYPN